MFLFFAISNLAGFNAANNPIAVKPGASEDYVNGSTILQNKCVDCHSSGMTQIPIYSELPIAKQLISKDIEKGGQRFNLTRETYSGEEAFTLLMLARLEDDES